MLSATEVRNLLISDSRYNNLIPDTKTFCYFIPEENQSVESAPLSLIRPISDVSYSFASNKSISNQNSIQAQIWCDFEDEYLEDYIKILDEIMESAGWYQYWGDGPVKDPTIDLLMITRRYRKIEYKTN